jgi:hypothetical protein
MRRRASAVAASVALAVASLMMATTAHASPPTCVTVPGSNVQTCTTDTSTPGSSGDTGTADAGVCIDASASVDHGGTTYPCSQDADGLSWWYVGGGCYSSHSTTIPPAGDKAWHGHKLGDNGIIVNRSCALPPSIANSTLEWERCIANCVNFGPQYLEEALNLTAPGLQMAPASGSQGFVKQNIWFWSAVDMSDRTETVTSGANSITGTRTLTSVDWDWGDGTAHTHLTKWPDACRPYTLPDKGAPAPPGCGHVYPTPSATGKPYNISVTVQWTYTYSINGGRTQTPPAGQGPKPMTSTATITITEGQSTNG